MYGDLLVEEDEVEDPDDFMDRLNPDSLEVLTDCRVEPSLRGAEPGSRYQFERKGYFCVDPDTTDEAPVFNLTVSMRDKWRRIQKQRRQQG